MPTKKITEEEIVFQRIRSDKSTINVAYLSHKVSNNPLFSESYKDCVGTIIMGGGFAALSHYSDYSYAPEPKKYLNEMIKEISDLTPVDELTAAIIGGKEDHFNKNKEILADTGIPIVGVYLDYYPNGKPAVLFGLICKKIVGAVKSVVVIPSMREVIIYCRKENGPSFGYNRIYSGHYVSQSTVKSTESCPTSNNPNLAPASSHPCA